MLITLKSIVFSPTKYRTFAHQSIVFSPTSAIVLSPTTTMLNPLSLLGSAKRNNARASLTCLTFLTQNLEGALPPLQPTLQEGTAKGMRASTHAFLSLVAVTTKSFERKALLFIPRPLIKTIRGFRGIKRTLRARGLTFKCFYSWSAVMQSGGTQPLKRPVVTNLQTDNAN